jgi:20S proteasome alpha/beta subunit
VLKQIADLLARTPFEPFSIVTTSGREYRVDHPENAAIVGGRVVVALPNEEGVVTLGGPHIAASKDFSRSQEI